MRFIVAIAIVLVAFAITRAQATGDATYKFGDATATIPAPTGFENIIDAIPNDHGRFSANEGAGLLAIQVPSESITQLKATPLMSLDIYTRVVVAPAVKEKKITADDFAQVVAEYKKNLDNIYDTGGNVMTSARNDVRTWMSQVRGRITYVDISKPRRSASLTNPPTS